MSKRWSVATFEGEWPPEPVAWAARKRGDETFDWPAVPDPLRVRVSGASDRPYDVDVEFVRGDDGEAVPVGLTVRRVFPTRTRKERGVYVFAESARLSPVTAQDLRHIPFGRIIRAATVAFERPLSDDERHDELGRALVPRGRPPRGHSVNWYRDLAELARRYKRQGLSPAKEIARRKNVDANLVHQWLHTARHRFGEEI